MKKLLIYTFLSTSLILAGCGDNPSPSPDPTPDPTPEEIVYQEETVDLCLSDVREYLDAETSKEQYRILTSTHSYNSDSATTVSLSFNRGESPYTIEIANNKEMTNPTSYSSKDPKFIIPAPIPGTDYYWKAFDATTKLVGNGVTHTVDKPVRYVNVDKVMNFRDLGGWSTSYGRKVSFSNIYRGAELDGFNSGNSKMSDNGKSALRDLLNIKTEIDLRDPLSDGAGQKESMFGEYKYQDFDVNFLHENGGLNASQYDGILDSTHDYPFIQRIFSYLGKEEAYPIYFHCIGGADRTGTLAFLINGILGVSDADLIRDYEVTSFCSYGDRWRSGRNATNDDWNESGHMDADVGVGFAFGRMLKRFNEELIGKNLSEKIVNFLVSTVGVSQYDINFMMSKMLNLPKVSHVREKEATCLEGGVEFYQLEEGKEPIEVHTSKLNHDWHSRGSSSTCSLCGKKVDYQVIKTDIKTGLNFGNTAISASLNNKNYTLTDGKLTLENNFASSEPVEILVQYSSGEEKLFDATIYSLIVDNENELLDINKYEFNISNPDGTKYALGYYLLNCDIECSKVFPNTKSLGIATTKSEKGGFAGVFDGNGHKISNFVTSGKDGALINTIGRDGVIKNLTLVGSTGQAFNGNDFVCAYTYSGSFENIKLEVSMDEGSTMFHNTALLGTICYKTKFTKDVNIKNVSIKNISDKEIGYSNALGMFWSNLDAPFIGDHIKIDGLSILNFRTFMLFDNKKIESKEDLINLIGQENIKNLVIS